MVSDCSYNQVGIETCPIVKPVNVEISPGPENFILMSKNNCPT